MRTGTATQASKTSVNEPVPENKEIRELHNRIALRAYQIFEDGGKVQGHDVENWLQAEQEILSDRMNTDFG